MTRPILLLVSHAGINISLFRRALILRLAAEGFRVHVAVPDDGHLKAIANLGAEVHPWALSRGSLNPLGARAAIRDLQAIVQNVGPDLVHSFTHQPNIFARLAMTPDTVLFNSITGLGSNFLAGGFKGMVKRALFHALYRATAPRCQTLIFQNDDDRGYFDDRGLTGSATVSMVRGTGVDTRRIRPDAFSPREVQVTRMALSLTDDHVVFTLAARLIRDKGVFEFMQAARSLAATHPQARFLVVGEPDPGNPTSLPLGDLTDAACNGRIIPLGWRKDMDLIWAISDVAVLPSYREGLPVSLQEAMASGLPVITTDAPGCRDIVDAQTNGLLVPVADAQALAQAMAELEGAPKRRQRMGLAGRKRAEKLFDSDLLAAQIIALYRHALQGSNHE